MSMGEGEKDTVRRGEEERYGEKEVEEDTM